MKKASNAESIVLRVLWENDGALTSMQIKEKCKEKGYVWEITSVMTFLSHLLDKHLVQYTVTGKSRYYTPVFTEPQYRAELLRYDLMDKLQLTPEMVFLTLTGEESTEQNIAAMKAYIKEHQK